MDILWWPCGSGYGFDGIVETYEDLPVDQTVPIGKIFLVRTGSGSWFTERHQPGIYERIAMTGVLAADWQYLGEWLEEFQDNNFTIYNATDSTKQLKFSLSGVSTGATRTLEVPNGSGVLTLTELPQVLTNKTLTAPTIAGGTHTGIVSLGIRSSGSGAFDLSLVNTENLTAGRALTLKVNDAARTLDLGGNLTVSSAATVSGTNTGDGEPVISAGTTAQYWRGDKTWQALRTSAVAIPKIGAATYQTAEDLDTLTRSAGVLVSSNYVTQATSTSVNVAAGQGLFRVSNSATAQLVSGNWPALSGLSVPAGTNRYVGVDYNGGTPTAFITTTFSDFNWYTKFPLAKCYQDGSVLHVVNATAHSEDTPNLTRQMLRQCFPFQATKTPEGGGLAIASSSRYFSVTTGSVWHGFNKFTLPAFDSSGAGRFTTYYRDGVGGFIATTSVQLWPNTQYDNGSGTLATMVNNRYGVLWFYEDVEDGDIRMMYGRGEYVTSAAAEQEVPPTTLPSGMSEHTLLLGRIIFQKSATSATLVQSALQAIFQTQGVTTHNDLSGLQGGTANEYYHLTSEQHTKLLAIGDSPSFNQISLSPGYGVFAKDNTAGINLCGGTAYNSGGKITVWATAADPVNADAIEFCNGDNIKRARLNQDGTWAWFAYGAGALETDTNGNISSSFESFSRPFPITGSLYSFGDSQTAGYNFSSNPYTDGSGMLLSSYRWANILSNSLQLSLTNQGVGGSRISWKDTSDAERQSVFHMIGRYLDYNWTGVSAIMAAWNNLGQTGTYDATFYDFLKNAYEACIARCLIDDWIGITHLGWTRTSQTNNPAGWNVTNCSSGQPLVDDSSYVPFYWDNGTRARYYWTIIGASTGVLEFQVIDKRAIAIFFDTQTGGGSVDIKVNGSVVKTYDSSFNAPLSDKFPGVVWIDNLPNGTVTIRLENTSGATVLVQAIGTLSKTINLFSRLVLLASPTANDGGSGNPHPSDQLLGAYYAAKSAVGAFALTYPVQFVDTQVQWVSSRDQESSDQSHITDLGNAALALQFIRARLPDSVSSSNVIRL